MASEVIALCQNFEQELTKTLAILPPVRACKPEVHDAHLNHHRLSQRLAESVSYYAGRLPAYASVPRILAFGDRLFRLEQHQLALQACYKHVRALELHTTLENLPRMDELTRLSCHVQAYFGCAACEAALLLVADPQIKHPDTLQWLEQCLTQLRSAIALALPQERLYWLVANGSVHVYTTAKAMISAGFAEQALPALIFCIKALEGHVCFAASKYLPWRTQLYTWAVYGLVDCRAIEQARVLLADGLKRIEQLVALQKLDPVPAAPRVQAALSAARFLLVGLQLKVEVAAGNPVAPVLAQLSAAAAAAAAAPGGGAAAATAMAQRSLAAHVEALHVPYRRIVRSENADATLKELFDAVMAIVAPLMDSLREALAQATVKGPGNALGGEGTPSQPSAESVAALRGAHESFPYDIHKSLMCAAYNLEQWEQFGHLAELAALRTDAAAAAVMGAVAGLHPDPDHSAAQLAIVGSLLQALRRLATETGVAALRQLAAALQQALTLPGLPTVSSSTGSGAPHASGAGTGAGGSVAGAPGTAKLGGTTAAASPPPSYQSHQTRHPPWRQLRDVITDASLALYGSARPLIDGVFCSEDKEAAMVSELLAACHAAWSAVELDDGELRVSVALKLALLLEQNDQLLQAKEVLLQAKSIVQQARVELMTANRRGTDEYVRWITASRSQPSDEAAAMVSGMTSSEQELACLHVDVLALLARCELGLGLSEQLGRANTRRLRVLEEQAARTAQSNIFGARNATEIARDEARLAAASATPPNPQIKERELLQACAKNPYERALLLIQSTAFAGNDSVRKAQLLQEAGDLLVKAQAAEDALFAASQPDLRTRRDVPPQPKVLQRTPTSVTLVAHPPGPGLKAPVGPGRKPPSCYIAYCKSYGAGVGLSMNKTASEYPGSGIMVPLGKPVTIQGLRTNDTYLFAVALYDDAGNLVGGLGTATPEVLLALPLPLYMCWTHLLAAAVRCGAWAAAKRAAGVLLRHFIVTTADPPLWRSNPMDAQRLHRAHVAAAARPLLRALVQSIYLYAGAALLRGMAPAAPVPQVAMPGTLPQLRAPFLEEQIARLKAARLLVMGMEVAALLPDEPLMQEGALRVYQLLAPLLALRAPRTPMLHKALSACHLVLSSLTNLVQDSLHRQEHQRALAARVTAAVSYQLLRLSDAADETAASAHFGRLKVELFKAYDPHFTIAGRPPQPTILQDEASRLHDVVLQHPRLPEWAPEPVLERQKDDVDLAARVLPMLATASPMDAWTTALGFETASEHPRWVELVVRMLEAAVRKGNPVNAALVADQLLWWVKARSKITPLTALEDSNAALPGVPAPAPAAPTPPASTSPPPPPPRWSVEEAAAALDPAQVGFVAPPPPPTDGLSPEEAAATLARHAEEVSSLELAQRRRVAAVMLLQRRLPKLLARKRVVEKTRANMKRWAPWLSRLNIVLGLMAAAEARKAIQQARSAPNVAMATELSTLNEELSDPVQETVAAPAAAAALPATTTGSGDGTGDGTAPLLPLGSTGRPPALDAMIYFSRAAHLAARGAAWLELSNAARHAWNLSQGVLNQDPVATAPVPPIVWERGLLPVPPQPPDSMLVPATPAVVEKKDKKAKKGDKKDDKKEEKEDKRDKKATPKAGNRKKGQIVEEAPPAPPRTYPLPVGSCPNMGRATRALTEALMELVGRLRDGLQLHTWVAPVAGQDGEGASAAKGEDVEGRPGTAAVSDSQFSYGSDLQVDIWYKEGPLDMAWVSRFMGAVAVVLSRCERWHSLVDVGRTWARLSEGVFNERLMPWLLQACPRTGTDPGPFQAALDTLIRDKNQALDQLDKVRLLVRERLGETPIMAQGMGHKVRKRRRTSVAPRLTGGGAGGIDGRPSTTGTSSLAGAGSSMNLDSVSMASAAYTYRTASTFKTKASQPDFVRIPAEYEKVIEVLKRRNEKGFMVLAMHELGDVHAHFGNWGGAATAWNDTLDTLLGPYQAIKTWRSKLDSMQPGATLQAYGLHGLLLGAVLSGKLARYTYHDNLHLRLEVCRLAARLAFCAFSSHLGHPQRPLSFATYTPRELWAAGADAWVVWNDPYRCPVADLAGALETVALCLLDNGFALEALPVVALWEHVAKDVTRNLHATVLSRIVRCRALAALGLLAEGISVASDLMCAANLPDPTLDSNYVLKDPSGAVVQVEPAPPYDNALLPGHPANKATLMYIADTQLHTSIERLYGSWLVAHLSLLRAQLLMLAGAVPNQWRSTNWKSGERVEVPKPATPPATKGGAKGGAAAAAAGAAAAAAAAAVAATEVVGVGLPEVVEPLMLDRSYQLLKKALVMARGEDQPAVTPPTTPPVPAGGGKSGAKSPQRASSPAKAGARGQSKSPITSAKGAPTPPPPVTDAGPPAPPPTTAGQRGEVMVRTLLLQCELEQLRWQPARGLAHALEAARFIGTEADRVISPQQGDNDELERYTLLPVLWFLARGAAVRCAAQLGHAAHVHALVQGALERNAAAVQEQLHVACMLHIQALVLAQEGRTAEALAALGTVAARYRALALNDTRLASVLLDAAALRDRMALRADAAELAAQGLTAAESYAMQMGLGEALAAPELTNVYADGTALYAHALGMAAVHASRRQRHAEAEHHALQALRLLRHHTRGLPAQHAEATLAVGRAARMVALCGDGVVSNDEAGTTVTRSGGIAATASKLSAARTALMASITLACLDGGHLRGLMRSALLELASIYIAGMDTRSAAFCLRAAHAAAAKQDLVLLSSHQLAPVTSVQLPDWAIAYVKGQEARFANDTGGNPDAPITDVDVARMVVCLHGSLIRTSGSLPVSGGLRARAQAMVAALHAALRYACAKYGMDACFSDPPLPPPPPQAASAAVPAAQAAALPGPGKAGASKAATPVAASKAGTPAAAAAAPPPPSEPVETPLVDGTVLVQWYCQDGCWQEPSSWIADGSLPNDGAAAAATLTEAQLLALPPVDSFASLLYIVATPRNDGTSSGPHCGEVTFSVRAVRELQRRVKQLRSRMERPKAATDILGYTAPSATELADLLHAAERLLSAVPRTSDDGSSSVNMSGPLDSTLSSSSAAEPPLVGAVQPNLDVSFLCRLEVLLNVDSGLEVVDATLGAWLVQTLPVTM